MEISGNIKNIIFDFGGVIIDLDMERSFCAFKALGVPGFEIIKNQMSNRKLIISLEKGEITPEVFRNELRKLAGKQIPDNALNKAWNALLLDIPHERIALLEKLKKKYRIFLMSNSNKIHYDYYVSRLKEVHGYAHFEEIFEKAYFSFNTGLYKPDIKFYDLLVSEQNLIPFETLFIDDTLQNTESANKAGLNGYHLKEGETINSIFGNIENL
ncbi:MAG: HAD family phosphatase [Bacteroidia bacterium]|nr:HAD family phosphatase [Bacteroidia bacterium]